ncbi:CD160 antigen [Rhynchocyon petersi]
MCKITMALGKGCFALVILLAIVAITPGGCIKISSSTSQNGKQLNLTCTVWYKKEEAEGMIVFLCKITTRVCSPETSLKHLKEDRGPDDVSERPSHLVFTINEVKTSHNGTYQCVARSQNPETQLQGHFFSILVTETGNYTVKGLKQYSEYSHSKAIPSLGFSKDNAWMKLAASLVILQVL